MCPYMHATRACTVRIHVQTPVHVHRILLASTIVVLHAQHTFTNCIPTSRARVYACYQNWWEAWVAEPVHTRYTRIFICSYARYFVIVRCPEWSWARAWLDLRLKKICLRWLGPGSPRLGHSFVRSRSVRLWLDSGLTRLDPG